MAKPASVPTWATDTNYPASVMPWASSPTKVQPPSGLIATGWQPEDPPPAQYENWLKNLQGQWIQYFSDRDTATIPIPAADGNPAFDTTSYNLVESGVTITATGPVAVWLFGVTLPVGTRVKNVRAFVLDNATGPTTVRLAFYRQTASTGANEAVTSVDSSGGGTNQTLTLTALNDTIAAGKLYVIKMSVIAGSAGITIRGIELDVDVP